MKQNKPLIITIIILAAIVLGLGIFIVVDKTRGNNDSSKSSSEPSSDVEPKIGDFGKDDDASVDSSYMEEESDDDDDADDDDDKASDSSDDKDSQKSSSSEDSKDLACYAKITETGNWNDGKKYVYQYNVDIINSSSKDIDDWEVKIDGFKGAEMGDGWNAEYKISGDTLSCKAVEYNETVSKGAPVSFGFQAKFKSSEQGAEKKEPKLYVDGKLYEVKKEEPSTSSKKDKEASKKEKKAPEKGTPLENHGALSIKGTDIVDKSGKNYQLKGISTHGLAWFPDYVNKDAFQTLRDDWGVNLIRLAMYTAESGGYCQDGDKTKLKKLVEDGVDYATELGMYVIIDWHILSDNNPHINETEAVSFFDEMSSKYSDYDNVLYEICNEPNGGTTWEDVKSYAEEVIPVIRANDKDAIIIVGTPTWSQDVDIASENPIKGEENIAYAVHFYAATHKENIRDKVEKARDKGLCVFISEFSICDASGNGGIDYDSADDWLELIDDNDISYASWNLSNKDETSALINSDSDKLSDWSDEDLSETGKWIKNQIKED